MLAAGDTSIKNTGKFDTERLDEIISLSERFRRHRILAMMKQVIAKEKHETELRKQKELLTSNRTLWDQLAEAEKRE